MKIMLFGFLTAAGATGISLGVYKKLNSYFPNDLSMFLSGVFIFTLIVYVVVIAVGEDIILGVNKKKN